MPRQTRGKGTLVLGAALVALAGCATAGTQVASSGAPAEQATHASLLALNSGEVEEGQLALGRASNAGVRDFASMMVRDHSGALAQLQASMQRLGMNADLAMGNGSVTTGVDAATRRINGENGVTDGLPAGSATAGTPLPSASASGDAAASAQLTLTPGMRTMLAANRYSAPIVADHQQAMARLQAQSGAAFDRAYVGRQVEAHRSALRTIDNLLPSLRAGGSSESVAMVEGMRDAVARHLQNALQLQASLR